MKTDDMPLFARLLAQHGIDPHLVPQKFTVEMARYKPGVIVDTIATGENGDELVDAEGRPVVYRKFYPEPEEPR